MIAISLGKNLAPHIAVSFALLYIGLSVCFLQQFFHWDVNLYAGLLLAPFIGRMERAQFSLRYLMPAAVAICLGILMPVKSVLFIAMVFSAMLLLENSIGKISPAFLFLLILVSPVFKSFLSILDFPVRLWLTDQVAGLLNSNGIDAIATGNQIQMDKFDFSVDPACAGLHMLVVSLIICLFLLMQRHQDRQAGFLLIAFSFAITIALNVASNFFRILVLVMFKIMPGTVLHDVLGVVCLLLYVILPLFLAVKWLMPRFGQPVEVSAGDAVKQLPLSSFRYLPLHVMIAASLVFIASQMVSADTLMGPGKEIQLPGFKKTHLQTGIIKLENKDALVYLKHAAFYIPGHDPKLCWTGSGYVFKNIKAEQMGGRQIYTALLQKGSDKIYAAWWFDNGSLKTVDQLEWRWEAARHGIRFYLININAANRRELEKQTLMLLANTTYLK